jgi:copper chaperone CopZ
MNVDGVVNADVSFEDATAMVTIRPDRVRGEDLTRAVQEAGFEAQVVEDGSNDPSGAARTNREQP